MSQFETYFYVYCLFHFLLLVPGITDIIAVLSNQCEVGIPFAIKTGMAEEMLTDHAQHYCGYCVYFQEEEWDTGYCQFHHMYVLKTFDCPEFVPCPPPSVEE